MYQRLGDRFGEARTLNNLGIIELYLGRYHQAIDHLGRAEALSREAGAHPVTGYARLNLGRVAWARRKPRRSAPGSRPSQNHRDQARRRASAIATAAATATFSDPTRPDCGM